LVCNWLVVAIIRMELLGIGWNRLELTTIRIELIEIGTELAPNDYNSYEIARNW